MKRRLRVVIGVAVWIGATVGLGALLHDPEDQRKELAAAHTRDWILTRRTPIVVEFPEPVELAVGDPIFFAPTPGDLTLVGAVTELVHSGPPEDDSPSRRRRGVVRSAKAWLSTSGHSELKTTSPLTYISVPQTASWVVQTLFPEERLGWIAREWNATLLQHRDEIFGAIQPLVEDTVVDLERTFIADLPEAIGRHQKKISAIVDDFQSNVVRKEFLPILEDELFPLFLRRAKPSLDAIGTEVLERLPVWSFTWRLLYERLPLTGEDYLRMEWNRFVANEVAPILRTHIGDVLGAFQDVVAEVAKNPKVGATLRRTIEALLRDRELQREIRLIFQELILDNPRFHRAMERRWRSPEMKLAIDRLTHLLAPFFKRVTEVVFGTRGGGITPEFARVLRTQVLEKDRRWLLLEASEAGAKLDDDQVFRARLSSKQRTQGPGR